MDRIVVVVAQCPVLFLFLFFPHFGECGAMDEVSGSARLLLLSNNTNVRQQSELGCHGKLFF